MRIGRIAIDTDIRHFVSGLIGQRMLSAHIGMLEISRRDPVHRIGRIRITIIVGQRTRREGHGGKSTAAPVSGADRDRRHFTGPGHAMRNREARRLDDSVETAGHKGSGSHFAGSVAIRNAAFPGVHKAGKAAQIGIRLHVAGRIAVPDCAGADGGSRVNLRRGVNGRCRMNPWLIVDGFG